MSEDNDCGPVDLTGLEPDILEVVRHKQQTASTDADGYYMDINEDDINRLIAELEECRAEINELEDQVKWLRHLWRQEKEELEEHKDENLAFNHIFDLQQIRLKRAQKLWQQATGRTETIPDLGVVLDWLVEVRYSEWISVKERLPEIIYGDNGGVNMVMVYLKNGFDGSGDIQIWNTVYLHNNKCNFTHWMPLPELPREAKK